MRAHDMRIGIVGMGVMGRGIAQVAAQCGFQVRVFDASLDALTGGFQAIGRNLEKLEGKGLLGEQTASEVRGRIVICNSLSFFQDVDFVIEAVSENAAVKCAVFETLDGICPRRTIFASNTSHIQIAELAAAIKRPRKFIGMHFMNPPPLVTLLEIIAGTETSLHTLRTTRELALLLKRDPIVFSRDEAGFIINGLIMPVINNAAWQVEDGRASLEDVNKAVIVGVGGSKAMPILELADFIGLDVCLAMLEDLRVLCGPSYIPAPNIRSLVASGHLGRKTGRGFFEYDESGRGKKEGARQNELHNHARSASMEGGE